MKGMGEDDAATVARARAGDESAFQALVEAHSRAVFRLACRITGNEYDAEDVVQEAFLKAYRRLDQFESRAHFGSWLHRIAANCAFDVLRGRARRDEQPLEADPDGPGVSVDPPAEDPAPDRLVFSGEVRHRLTRAMARLTPLEKSAFVLRHHEGMSIQEIGGLLGLDVNATKHSVFRAVRKLREALQPMLATRS
jgi:RNA polymerase sigma-70 factor (ECF subfamily)